MFRVTALTVVMICSLLTPALAQEPVSIPKLPDVQIDGDVADWGDRGMRYDVLTEAVPTRKPYADHDATVRIGWNDTGLLVRVDVIDRHPMESTRDGMLWEGDGVELFFAPDDKGPYVQFIVAPGLDPKKPELRSQMQGGRPEQRGQPTGATFAAKKTDTGYTLEAMLPWSIHEIKVGMGTECRLQVYANDLDPGRPVASLVMYPEKGWRDMKKTIRLKLDDKASAPVTAAASAGIERWRRLRVNVATTRDGKAGISGGEVSTVAMPQPQAGERLRTVSLVRPVPTGGTVAPLIVAFNDEPVRTITLPDQSKARLRALADNPVVASPSVFDRPQFPTIDFRSPAEAEDLIGLYSLSSKFYDAEFNEVATPAKPGRYGAIVTVTRDDGGEPITRFVTLYRTPGQFRWRSMERPVLASLPPRFGIDPVVLQQRSADVGDYLNESVWSISRANDGLATFLAGLSETKPTVTASVQRTGPWAMGEAWWYELQKRTGTLQPYQYVTNLPKDYDQQPDRKYPLILFLHGSGERTVPLAEVASNGPWRFYRDKTEQLPFVIVSPQCPPGEWWNPLRLRDLLDEVSTKYRIDADRVYLTGLSMGGFGSWTLSMHDPERFAAVVPICGGGDPADVARIKDVPTWVFHGGKDDVVLPEESYRMVEALRDLHGRVRFTLYPEADHNSWTVTYNNPVLYEWLLKQRRGTPDQPPATLPGTRPSE